MVQLSATKEGRLMDQTAKYIANAILGIDTLWGGDVMCASGTGRFIADSWFSDEPLPIAYTTPAAAKLREWGGVTGKAVEPAVVEQYLRDVDIPAAIAGMKHEGAEIGGHRGRYLASLSDCLTVMWGLAMEILGKGPAVPYERCVVASTARAPEPSQPEGKCQRVAELLDRAGFKSADRDGLLQAVDAWRRERTVPMGSVKAMGAAVITQFDQLSA